MKILLQAFFLFLGGVLFAQQNEYTIYEVGKGEILKNKYFYLGHYVDDLFIAVPLRDSVDYTYADLAGIITIKEEVKLPFQYRNIEKVRDDYGLYKEQVPLLAISNGRGRALYRLNSSVFEPLTDFKYLKFRPYLFDGQYLMAYNGFGQMVNLETREITNTNFTELLPLNNDLIAAIDMWRKCGILNKQGDTILLPTYDRINNISEQLITISEGETLGVLDAKGVQIVPPIYRNIILSSTRILAKSFDEVEHIYPELIAEKEEVMDFDLAKQTEECRKPFIVSSNYAKKREIFNLCGAFDFYGNQKIPFEYYSLTKGISNEIIANKNGKMGVITEDGRVVLDFEYDDITTLFDVFYLVTKEDKQGLFIQGSKKLLEVMYKDIFPISAHSVLFLEHGEWSKVTYRSEYKKHKIHKTNLNANYSFAYMDTFNRTTATYEKNTDFFVVLECSNSGIVDKHLNVIIPCKHREIPRYFNEKFFNFEKKYTVKGIELKDMDLSEDNVQFKEVIIGKKGEKYGVVNDKGTVLVPFQYSHIQPIDGKRFVVRK